MADFNRIEFPKEKGQSLLVTSIIPLIALAVVTQLYILLPVVHVMNQLLKVTSDQSGLLTTFFGIFYAIGFLLWGVLSDKYGREKIIIAGLAGLAIITTMISFTNNYHALLVMRCVQGFIASSYPPVILAWVAENYNDKSKKRLVSFLSCSFLLAGTLGQLYGVVMIENSLMTSMLSLSLIYFLGGLIFLFKTKKKSELKLNKEINIRLLISNLTSALKDKKLSYIYLSCFFVLMSFVSIYYILISGNLNNDIDTFNIKITRNMATLGMLTCLISGRLFQFFHPLKVLAISLFLMSITLVFQFLLIKNWNAQYMIPFLIFHTVFSAMVSLAIPSMITCTTLFSNNSNRGSAISLYTCILFIGASLGSYLPGVINTTGFFILVSLILTFISLRIFFIKPTIS